MVGFMMAGSGCFCHQYRVVRKISTKNIWEIILDFYYLRLFFFFSSMRIMQIVEFKNLLLEF